MKQGQGQTRKKIIMRLELEGLVSSGRTQSVRPYPTCAMRKIIMSSMIVPTRNFPTLTGCDLQPELTRVRMLVGPAVDSIADWVSASWWPFGAEETKERKAKLLIHC